MEKETETPRSCCCCVWQTETTFHWTLARQSPRWSRCGTILISVHVGDIYSGVAESSWVVSGDWSRNSSAAVLFAVEQLGKLNVSVSTQIRRTRSSLNCLPLEPEKDKQWEWVSQPVRRIEVKRQRIRRRRLPRKADEDDTNKYIQFHWINYSFAYLNICCSILALGRRQRRFVVVGGTFWRSKSASQWKLPIIIVRSM